MRVQIRDAIIAYVEADYAAAFPTIHAEFDNAPFDLNNLASQYVCFEIVSYGGGRISVGGPLRAEDLGYIYVTAYAKVGEGSRKPLLILDWFAAKLNEAIIITSGGTRVELAAASSVGSSKGAGWYGEKTKFKFRAYTP